VSVDGYVLAGGGSTRFGRDKALVPFGKETLLVRLCSLVAGVTDAAAILGSSEKYGAVGVPCIADQWPGEGPLGGIVTALEATGATRSGRESSWNLIVGCDMPFLTADWLAYLIERATGSGAEVVVPKSDYGLEPLCACWRTSARAELQSVFDRGVRKITEAIKHLSVEILDETHWKRFDSADRLFWNMNTLADYDEAKQIVEKGRA
jgi:molybdopterin-guanine dinucleotide biosynthesis protein A